MLSFAMLRVIPALGGSVDAAVNKTGKELDLVGGTRKASHQLRTRSLRTQIAFANAEIEKLRAVPCKGAARPVIARASVGERLRETESVARMIKQHTGELRGLVF